jgi:hypothetical protein
MARKLSPSAQRAGNHGQNVMAVLRAAMTGPQCSPSASGNRVITCARIIGREWGECLRPGRLSSIPSAAKLHVVRYQVKAVTRLPETTNQLHASARHDAVKPGDGRPSGWGSGPRSWYRPGPDYEHRGAIVASHVPGPGGAQRGDLHRASIARIVLVNVPGQQPHRGGLLGRYVQHRLTRRKQLPVQAVP